jgi:hypothetical protein
MSTELTDPRGKGRPNVTHCGPVVPDEHVTWNRSTPAVRTGTNSGEASPVEGTGGGRLTFLADGAEGVFVASVVDDGLALPGATDKGELIGDVVVLGLVGEVTAATVEVGLIGVLVVVDTPPELVGARVDAGAVLGDEVTFGGADTVLAAVDVG